MAEKQDGIQQNTGKLAREGKTHGGMPEGTPPVAPRVGHHGDRGGGVGVQEDEVGNTHPDGPGVGGD